jgi:hypothetical protein
VNLPEKLINDAEAVQAERLMPIEITIVGDEKIIRAPQMSNLMVLPRFIFIAQPSTSLI